MLKLFYKQVQFIELEKNKLIYTIAINAVNMNRFFSTNQKTNSKVSPKNKSKS